MLHALPHDRADASGLARNGTARPRILAQIVFSVFATLAGIDALAQGTRYTVRIDAPGPLDELLEDNLDLMRWRDTETVDIEQLQRLVKEAPAQARTLIETEGYYSARVSAGVETGAERPVARIIVDTGPATLVGDVNLVLTGFEPLDPSAKPFDKADLQRRWGLPVGQRFRTADWEASKRNLLRQVTQRRYPRAQITESQAVVDPDVQRALLKVVLDSGPEARFGELRIEGLKRYPESIIRNLNDITPGSEYNEAALQALQARLQDARYFSSVEVAADMGASLDEEIDKLEENKAEGEATAGSPVAAPKPPVLDNPQILPVVIRVTENKQKNVEAGVGFSTNTGGRAQVSYDDLYFYKGLRLESDLLVEQKRQSARADFFFPTTTRGFNDSFGAGFERYDLRGETIRAASVSLRRAWGSPRLERSVGIEFLSEQRHVAGRPVEEDIRAKSLPVTYTWLRRELDNLLLPTRGYVIDAQANAAVLPLLTDERFLRTRIRAITYRPLSSNTSIIVRGEVGAVASKQKAGIPGTFLFRAGGDQSVRGYGYQRLGVKEGDAIVGGKYLVTGSVEYQNYFKPPWGIAVFYDFGNAADRFKDLKPESGYGVGARWRSPVGPINVDLAYGQAVKKFHLHFSLGFTF